MSKFQIGEDVILIGVTPGPHYWGPPNGSIVTITGYDSYTGIYDFGEDREHHGFERIFRKIDDDKWEWLEQFKKEIVQCDETLPRPVRVERE